MATQLHSWDAYEDERTTLGIAVNEVGSVDSHAVFVPTYSSVRAHSFNGDTLISSAYSLRCGSSALNYAYYFGSSFCVSNSYLVAGSREAGGNPEGLYGFNRPPLTSSTQTLYGWLIARNGGSESQISNPYNTTCRIYKDRYLLVTDSDHHMVKVYDLEEHTYLFKFGNFGSGSGEFNKPRAIHIDEDTGIALICDQGNSRITVWYVRPENSYAECLNIEFPVSPAPRGIFRYRERCVIGTSSDVQFCEFDETNYTLTVKETVSVSQSVCFNGVRGQTDKVLWRLRDEVSGKDVFVYSLPAYENTVVGVVEFDGVFSQTFVVQDISFDNLADSPGIVSEVNFSAEAEGWTQNYQMEADISFTAEGELGPTGLIEDVSFSIVAGEYGMPHGDVYFDINAMGHYVLSGVEFSIQAESWLTKFCEMEADIAFDLLVSYPKTAAVRAELEPLEVESNILAGHDSVCSLVLEGLIIEAAKAPDISIELEDFSVSALGYPQSYGLLSAVLDGFAVSGAASVPFAVNGTLLTSGLNVVSVAEAGKDINGKLRLGSMVVSSFAESGAVNGQGLMSLPNLTVFANGVVIPSVVGKLVVPEINVNSSQTIRWYSIEELYSNGSLQHIQDGNYLSIDGYDIQAVVWNPESGGFTKIGYPGDYAYIDLGYIDIHKASVNNYLVVFISGSNTDEDEIGKLIVNNYTYPIKKWVTDGEWRVLLGKGLTRKTRHNPDQRFIRVKLKLIRSFELKSITILATPNPKRIR